MSNSIKLNREIFVEDVAEVAYTENIESDGDIIDHEPVSFGVDCSTLKITLSDGQIIIFKDAEATATAEILKEKFPKILD